MNECAAAGGVYCSNSSPTLENTIIAFSTTGTAVTCFSGGNPSLVCCDLYGNASGDWVGCVADQAGINGNFSAHPLFCGAENPDEPLAISSQSWCAPDHNPSCGLVGALGVGCTLSDVEEPGQHSSASLLKQNVPNPFGPSTTIRFELPASQLVCLTIHTAGGRHVATLVDREMTAGRHEIVWTGRDDHGMQVASGMYFYALRTGTTDEARCMVVVK